MLCVCKERVNNQSSVNNGRERVQKGKGHRSVLSPDPGQQLSATHTQLITCSFAPCSWCVLPLLRRLPPTVGHKRTLWAALMLVLLAQAAQVRCCLPGGLPTFYCSRTPVSHVLKSHTHLCPILLRAGDVSMAQAADHTQRGRCDFIVGLVGKPSAGKVSIATFLALMSCFAGLSV